MAEGRNLEPIVMEGVRIIFRNFSGNPDRFNPNGGHRTFHIILDEENAKAMQADGWNVKQLRARDQEDIPPYVLKVVVKYGGKGQPPHVVMITSKGKTNLDESMVPLLDWATILDVDCIVRPWEYDVGGRQGIAAYLKSIYVTIDEDPLERKYLDVPDTAQVNSYDDDVAGQEGPTE